MLLSIIVISHNQREQLKRCVDSILAQQIPFDYEVLISDDASKDGSFELAREYAERYSMVHAYSCDTNTMNPSNKSSRSGYNRCNALQHARGKYVAHIDGDDFLIKDSQIYQKQVVLLEKHPECACCMANCYTLCEGADVETKQLLYPQEFGNGYILKSEDYIRDCFRVCTCSVYRRNPQYNPVDILGGYYVDNALTAFYLQFGDIVCLDDAGYVYVQYQKSVWHAYSINERKILGCPALFNAFLIPKWKPVYWQSGKYLGKMKEVVEIALCGEKVSEETNKWMRGMNSYLFHAFNRRLTMLDKIHLRALEFLIGVMRRTKRKHPSWPLPWRLLDKLI